MEFADVNDGTQFRHIVVSFIGFRSTFLSRLGVCQLHLISDT